MATLRVDVEAARARAELERTARAVDDLNDELAQAQVRADAAARAFDNAGDNVRQLEHRASAADREVDRLRNALAVMPAAGVREATRQPRQAGRNALRVNGQLGPGPKGGAAPGGAPAPAPRWVRHSGRRPAGAEGAG